MAGQPSAPEDHAATLLQAEPRSHDTVFMVRVQRRFRSWGLMVRRRSCAVWNHVARLVPFILRDARKRAPQDEVWPGLVGTLRYAPYKSLAITSRRDVP